MFKLLKRFSSLYSNPIKYIKKINLQLIYASFPLSIHQLAQKIKVQPTQIHRYLFKNIDSIMIDQAEIIGLVYGKRVIDNKLKHSFVQKSKPPIITIMGHVDHGKTTLLDFYRNSKITQSQFGGITQKIGAFNVKTKSNKIITFIDTPGHKSFVNMRQRGAIITDVIILVVSAIQGVQNQTIQVINLARKHNIPIIVAINKIDYQSADVLVIQEQLKDKGGLNIHPLGGNIPVVHISAKKGRNLDLLLQLIEQKAEQLKLKQFSNMPVQGFILQGRKCDDSDIKSAISIITRGQLAVGNFISTKQQNLKVKILKDQFKKKINCAPLSSAVEILGFKQVPKAGDIFFQIINQNKAKLFMKAQSKKQVQDFQNLKSGKIKIKNWRQRKAFYAGYKDMWNQKFQQAQEKLQQQIDDLKQDHPQKEQAIKKKVQQLQAHKKYVQKYLVGQINQNYINIIIKCVDLGTLQAITSDLQPFFQKQKNDEIKVVILNKQVGTITQKDIKMAKLFSAKILTMDVNVGSQIYNQCKKNFVQLRQHKLIYSIQEDIVNLKYKKQAIKGKGTIMKLFKLKHGKKSNLFLLGEIHAAGVKVQRGFFQKNFIFRIIRDSLILKENLKIFSMKHFKKQVNVLKKDEQCTIIFQEFSDFKQGDAIEAMQIS